MQDGQREVAIIGGGAAGMMSAIYAALNGALVTLFEKNDRLGKKLAITGKGRCNVTNDCDNAEFLKNVISNPKFLYASISNFSTADTKAFFENAGVPLKTERGRRVFPESDKAWDIVNALKKTLIDYGVKVKNEKALEIIMNDGMAEGVKTSRGEYRFDAVVIATGGASYTGTGSDGDGFRFAEALGHGVTPLVPSLVPLETTESVKEIMGVSLKNVVLKIRNNENGKIVFEELGEMLFTHFGISGPLTLSASCHMQKIYKGKYSALIDFKPALDRATLDTRVLSDFKKALNKDFQNALGGLLPSKIIPFMIRKSGILPDTKVNAITKEERGALVDILKGLELEIKGFRPLNEAIVTQGGVKTNEINPCLKAPSMPANVKYSFDIVTSISAVYGAFAIFNIYKNIGLAK